MSKFMYLKTDRSMKKFFIKKLFSLRKKMLKSNFFSYQNFPCEFSEGMQVSYNMISL